jgi:hypothetical protein
MKPVGLTVFRSEYDASVDEIYLKWYSREAPVFHKKDTSTVFERHYVA